MLQTKNEFRTALCFGEVAFDPHAAPGSPFGWHGIPGRKDNHSNALSQNIHEMVHPAVLPSALRVVGLIGAVTRDAQVGQTQSLNVDRGERFHKRFHEVRICPRVIADGHIAAVLSFRHRFSDPAGSLSRACGRALAEFSMNTGWALRVNLTARHPASGVTRS